TPPRRSASRSRHRSSPAPTRSSNEAGELLPPSAVAHFEGGDEGGLRDFDFAELAHPLFTLFLLVEELSFAGDVAAIAFGEHVLAQRLDGLAGDDAAADRRLDRDGEELARDQVLQAFAQCAAAPLGLG